MEEKNLVNFESVKELADESIIVEKNQKTQNPPPMRDVIIRVNIKCSQVLIRMVFIERDIVGVILKNDK